MKALIAIIGAHCEPERMQAQRETWLKDLRGADYKYFLGWPVGTDQDVVYARCPDGPLWEGHQRSWVLNRKVEALASYALSGGYDFVFKCDDDAYIFPDRLLASDFEGHDYSGDMDYHHAEALGWYQWAQGGSGYWLSRAAMQVIDANGLQLVRAEDFAVGQLLARHGFAAHHDSRYIPNATDQQLSSPDPDVITLHKVNPRMMREIHKSKGEAQCP